MYFTQFPINMTRRESRKLLASPYMMHAAVAGSFPPDSAGDLQENGRVLWRVDRLREGGSRLYIVSPRMPSLIGLDEQIGWPDCDAQWGTREYDLFLARISPGQMYSFRLVANPTVSRSTRAGQTDIADSKGKSKRIGHLTVVQQAAWLVGRQASGLACSAQRVRGGCQSIRNPELGRKQFTETCVFKGLPWEDDYLDACPI